MWWSLSIVKNRIVLFEIHGLNSISIIIKYYLHSTHKSKWISTLENYYIKLFHQHIVIIKEQAKKKKKNSPVWSNLWHTTAACMDITYYCQTSSQTLNFCSLCSLLSLTNLVCIVINYYFTFLNISTLSVPNNEVTYIHMSVLLHPHNSSCVSTSCIIPQNYTPYNFLNSNILYLSVLY